MDYVLSAQGLRLNYLCDQAAVAALDTERILDDLTSDTPDNGAFRWLTRRPLAGHDHLVLVTDHASGRYLGLLAATDGATTNEEFLRLETAFVAPGARGQNLTRRMVALAMLAIAGKRPVPTVVVACPVDATCYRIIRETARRFTGAVCFPDPDSVTIDFRAATLARRIAREIRPDRRLQATTGALLSGMAIATGTGQHGPFARDPQFQEPVGQWSRPADHMLTVLDLRAASEATILADARRIYRSR